MMGTRAARPRATVKPSILTVNYLNAVRTLKGKQAALEALLKTMGKDLASCRSASTNAGRRGSASQAMAAKAKCLTLEKAIAACIKAIKDCAGKANQAADSAIASGATRDEAKAAAAAPLMYTAQVMPGSGTPVMSVQPVAAQAVPLAPSTAPSDVVVESSTATLTADVSIVPGADAQLTATPALSLPGEGKLTTQDVTVSSGSIGTVAVIGVAGLLAYMMLRKKGRV